MEVVVNLEFRKYEEYNYDFVDGAGKRQSGVSKTYLFMNEDEQLMKIGVPKEFEISTDMVKGQSYWCKLELILKPVVDKIGNVGNKQFFSYFQLLEVVANPFEKTEIKDGKKNEKF